MVMQWQVCDVPIQDWLLGVMQKYTTPAHRNKKSLQPTSHPPKKSTMLLSGEGLGGTKLHVQPACNQAHRMQGSSWLSKLFCLLPRDTAALAKHPSDESAPAPSPIPSPVLGAFPGHGHSRKACSDHTAGSRAAGGEGRIAPALPSTWVEQLMLCESQTGGGLFV